MSCLAPAYVYSEQNMFQLRLGESETYFFLLLDSLYAGAGKNGLLVAFQILGLFWKKSLLQRVV